MCIFSVDFEAVDAELWFWALGLVCVKDGISPGLSGSFKKDNI